MTTGSVAPLNAGCPCRPDPAELPVTLLSASVEDVSIEPTLMALTVDYETGRWRAEALARHILEPYQKLGPPPASLQVTRTVARVSDKAP